MQNLIGVSTTFNSDTQGHSQKFANRKYIDYYTDPVSRQILKMTHVIRVQRRLQLYVINVFQCHQCAAWEKCVVNRPVCDGETAEHGSCGPEVAVCEKSTSFLSRVSILTRDIDIANLSVRLSVTFRYQMKTA